MVSALCTLPIHAPVPRPYAQSFLPPLDNRRIITPPPRPPKAALPSPPSPELPTSFPPDTGVLRVQCRLLTLSGQRCEEWFDVGPNFKAGSEYGQHIATVHGLRSGSWPDKNKGRSEWICTWEGCICVKRRKEENQSRCDGHSAGHAAHIAHPLVHVRSHLPHRYFCERCGSDLGRLSSRKRHEQRDCQARKFLRDSKHEHQTSIHLHKERRRKATGPFTSGLDDETLTCPQCGRLFVSHDDLVYHRIMKECVSGMSG
jgi:hypothetical protein